MEKFNFNIRNFPYLQRITQDKIENYLDHANYKLRASYICIRKMDLQKDQQMIFAKLDSISWVSNCLQLHVTADGFPGVQLVTLNEDDVLIFFEETKDKGNFIPRFIYWDDKNQALPGINLKTLINLSRLDKFQLEKYWIHPNYMLKGRNAIVRSMLIDIVDKDTVRRFVGIPNYSSQYPIILVNYEEGYRSSQLHIGRESEDKDNDLVLIIFDKEGINPEFIYWED